MKDLIAYITLFLMALGTGFIFINWYTAGIATLMISITICIIAGLPYLANKEVERNENVR